MKIRHCQHDAVFNNCDFCRRPMRATDERVCLGSLPVAAADPPPSERVVALREARALIQHHAMSTWRGGLTERSDGITEVLADFDLKFPEALQ